MLEQVKSRQEKKLNGIQLSFIRDKATKRQTLLDVNNNTSIIIFLII